MTNFQEINDLRKGGRLEEAYQLASSFIKESPTDIWAKRAMGWVLYEYLDKTASYQSIRDFLKWLSSLVDLKVDASETMLLNSIAWGVRKLLADFNGKENISRHLDEIRALVQSFEFPKTEKSYSALLSAALKLENKWPNLHQFIRWWNLDNLQPDDFQEMRMENGVRMMSLAERAVIANSKSLLKCADSTSIEQFTTYLKDFVTRHPEYLYPPYYLAKLYLKASDKESAFRFLKPFAKSKCKDFWVWQLLADTQSDDELRLSFICKALLCGGKDEMLVSLREDAAILFAKLGYQSEAKLEALKAVETRNRNSWAMTSNLRSLQVEKWFVNVLTSTNNHAFYLKHTSKAETLVMGECVKLNCLVTYVNEVKQMISFVTENKGQGFFKIPKGTPKLRANQMIEIVANDDVEGRTMVKSVRIVEGTDNPFFFKPYEGALKLMSGFGMVDGVFVEPKFLSGKFGKEMVGGVAVISFDRKKNKWGWKVLTMNSIKQ